MIILDTHVWIWHVQGDKRLPPSSENLIRQNERSGLGISSISVWEVAKLVERGRLQFQVSIEEWLAVALDYPGIQLIHMTPEIYVESTRLPGVFHKDPADQMIVATARILDLPLMTFDSEILRYRHIRSIGR